MPDHTSSADEGMGTNSLCARVAVRVMGWHRERQPWAYDDAADLWHSEDGAPLMACPAWRPDEDDAQSMRTLDRMRALGFAYVLGHDGDQAEARFSHPDGRTGHAGSADRRIALLRAAVAALDART